MYNDEIISYNLSLHPNYEQVEDMLNKAFSKYSNLEGLIFHSDQGWQYQNQRYISSLKDKGIIQSMSRKGNCYDNCIIESFFGTLKNEIYYGYEKDYKSYLRSKKIKGFFKSIFRVFLPKDKDNTDKKNTDKKK